MSGMLTMVSLNLTVSGPGRGKHSKWAIVDRANGDRGQVQTPVSSAEEPNVDVKLCLVFPREALSVPVMRHMLGDACAAWAPTTNGLAELLLAVRGLHQRGAPRWPGAQI